MCTNGMIIDLFRFLESSLNCFASQWEYGRQGRDQYMVSFNPDRNDYAKLARIIDNIANDERYFEEYEIFYLRDAFDGASCPTLVLSYLLFFYACVLCCVLCCFFVRVVQRMYTNTLFGFLRW